MHIRGCVSTDAGTTRALCKDAAVLKVAASMRYGRIAFAVLCDGINEKMLDEIGDTVIEYDGDQPELIEDYAEDLRNLLQGGR